ncbi:MAG TPA: RNA-binding protein [Polyangiaceae bacterium]|jgi:RNA recognition motif-containing protein
MSKKLFVGGLSWGTTDEGLTAAFQAFGQILEARVVTDRDTGRSKGFGFVTFSDGASAAKAMQELDGSELDGRQIRVNEAQERPGGGGGDRRPGGGPRRGGGPGGGGGRDRRNRGGGRSNRGW